MDLESFRVDRDPLLKVTKTVFMCLPLIRSFY